MPDTVPLNCECPLRSCERKIPFTLEQWRTIDHAKYDIRHPDCPSLSTAQVQERTETYVLVTRE